MQTAIPCTVMRGGTSKGLYFLASDLPADDATLREVLLAAMGSPDKRQIDGMGGAHPLTSKVAIVSRSESPDADVDYLFIQVSVDKSETSDSQNCGNLLSGVGPFAIEQGLVPATGSVTSVRIRMVNSGSLAVAQVQTSSGGVEYEGAARIDGVPGSAAPVMLEFLDIAGASCGKMLPTGNVTDVIDGVQVTCIDNGMPVVLLNASDFGKAGDESPDELEADMTLRERMEAIRLKAGEMMNLGDVRSKTVPKMSLLAPARHGGMISTRTFIPHRVHEAIGVLGAVSVATGCVLVGSVGQQISGVHVSPGSHEIDVEHPAGFFTVQIVVESNAGDSHGNVVKTGLLRTARKIMRGEVYIPADIWSGP